MKSYDLIPENEGILFDLPFREGSGVITQDIAKPHHPITFNDPGAGVLSWDTLDSGLKVLDFLPAAAGPSDGNYLEVTAAKSTDLDFTTSDYSFAMWIYQRSGSSLSQLLAGKYQLNVKGWEIYSTESGALRYMTLRHHHANGTGATRTACYSLGWVFDNWWFLGISRVAGYPLMYRNAEAVEMAYSTGGILSPETAATSDLVMGARYSKDTNWMNGKYYRPRIWNRALSAKEWLTIFERERDYFGV